MSRVDLVQVGGRLLKAADNPCDGSARCPVTVTNAEALALADLIEKAMALVDTRTDDAPCCACANCWEQHDALAALFDKEGK